MDGFLSGLGTHNIKAGAAVFFEDINSGLDVINLFSDNQAALDACKSESLLVCPDFKNQCWIEHCHIVNIIHQKNLDVNWIKVKGYSSILGNVRADALAKDAVFSSWQLPYIVSEHFLKTDGTAISSNSRCFVCGVFQSVH
ncbi:hypothetical protein G9A89_001109 [Geosiphon pyriformis]|nr:hypothetical protein G9A89_001109 [Geosiphon pyriformis]